MKGVVERVYVGSASLWYDASGEEEPQRLQEELYKHCDHIVREATTEQVAKEFHQARFGLWVALNSFLKLNDKEFVDTIEFFRTCLSFNSRPEPTTSIYLFMPEHVRLARAAKRSINAQGSQLTSDIMLRQSPDKDKITLSRWRMVEQIVPYFHVIDGAMDQRSINDAIREIVD